MRAGAMRYFIEVLGHRTIRKPSGGVTKEWVVLYKPRAQKVKMSSRFDRDNLNAKEEFSGLLICFKVRKDARLSESTHVRFDKTLYKIQLREEFYNNEVLLWCNKIDE